MYRFCLLVMMIINTGTERSVARLGPVFQRSQEPAQKLDSKGESQTESQNQVVRTSLRVKVTEMSELASQEHVRQHGQEP